MHHNNQRPRSNPWGFQAMNWSKPTTRGPPPNFVRGPQPVQQTFQRGHSPVSAQGQPPMQQNVRGPHTVQQSFQRCPRPDFVQGQPSVLQSGQGVHQHNAAHGPRHSFSQGPSTVQNFNNLQMGGIQRAAFGLPEQQSIRNQGNMQNMQANSSVNFCNGPVGMQHNCRPNFNPHSHSGTINGQNSGPNGQQLSSTVGLQQNNKSFSVQKNVPGTFRNNTGPNLNGIQTQGTMSHPVQQCLPGGNIGMSQGHNVFRGPRPGNIHGPRGFSPGQNSPRPGPRPRFSSPPNFNRSPGFFGPRFQQNMPQKKKKRRQDKRDLPENNKYYCETCDRGYKDEDKYKLHLDTHEKCPKEGCRYVAAGKLVQLHIKLHHQSGLAKKIWSLESQEDIQRWREERKRNFPTVENIAKKKAALADKHSRGEVIEEKYFGKMRGKGNMRSKWQGKNWKRKQKFMNATATPEVEPEAGNSDLKRKIEDTLEGGTEEKKQKLSDAAEPLGKFFKAVDTSDSSSSSSEDSDEDNSDDDNKNAKMRKENRSSASTVPIAAAALGSLMSAYVGSDSSSDDDKEENNNVEEKVDCSAKDTVTEKLQFNVAVNPEDRRRNRRRPRRKNRGLQEHRQGNSNWMPPPKVDKSLLEKLLAKDIRRERNQIMQCVHYIVKHNFFQKNQTSTVINGNM